jgi:hypothetical protein
MYVPHFTFCSWFIIFSLILGVGRDGIAWFSAANVSTVPGPGDK